MDDPAKRDHSETRLETARRAFSPRGKPPVPDGTPAEIRLDIVWEAREPLPLARTPPRRPRGRPPIRASIGWSSSATR